MKNQFCQFGVILLLLCGGSPAGGAALVLETKISLGSIEGRMDHLAADVAGQRLYIAALANNTVEVVDLARGEKVRSLGGFAAPAGIAHVPKGDKVFVANSRSGAVHIIDGHTLRTISKIEAGDDADNVRYDEKAERIYVGYGDGGLAVLEAKTGQKTADIKLAGHPESFRLETAGNRIFVNVPATGQITVVDREKEAAVANWPLKDARSNFPMSLDEGNHRLLVGCRSPAAMLVYDPADGRMVQNVPIAGDADDLFHDAGNRRIYVSCGAGVIEVIRQVDADTYKKMETIPTAAGARTSLLVPEWKRFCVAVPRRGNQAAELWVYRTGEAK